MYGAIPNLTKEQITNSMVYPLMNQLRHDVGIKESYISVDNGSFYMALQYFDDVDSESRLWTLKTMMTQLKSTAQLPTGTSFRYYQKDIETRIKPFIVGVMWPTGETQSDRHIRDIISQFQSVPGIKDVDSQFDSRQMIITLNSDKMAQHQVRLIDVSRALHGLGVFQEDHVTRHLGHRIVMSHYPQKYTPDTLVSLPIRTVLGRQFRLGDIAKVTRQYYYQNSQVTIDGNKSCLMGLSLYPNASVTEVKKKISVLIQNLNQRLGYPKMMLIHDQAQEVTTFIHDFKWNILLGALLIFISLLILTTVKMGLLTSIMLPLTSLFSLSIMVLSGIQLQQVSLAGFIIALGLVVDNAIVLQEVVDTQFPRLDRATRIYYSVKQVFPSIAVSTLTTLMAFAPIYFIKSEEGLFLRTLPLSIWINLSVAFVLSLTLLPFLLYRWPQKWKLGLPSIGPLFHGVLQVKYGKLLRYCFKRPWIVFMLVVVSIMMIVGTFKYITLELMPSKKEAMFYINLINPNQSVEIPKVQVAQIESMLAQDPGVVRIISSIGRPIPRLDLSFREIGGAPGEAQILIYTASNTEKKRIINRVKQLLPELSYTPQTFLASLTYSEVFEYPIKVELYGVNHYELLKESEKMKQAFNRWDIVDHARISGIQEVSQLSFQINRKFQYAQGIIDQEMDSWINLVLSPLTVGSLLDEGIELPIQLVIPMRQSLQVSLEKTALLNQFGQKMVLSQFLIPEFKLRLPSIVFNNFLETVSILVKPNDGDELLHLQDKVDQYLNNYDQPPGIQLGLVGQLGKQNEVLGAFAIYSIIIVFLMYAILVVRFRSFSQPFLIYVTIPLSFMGSVMGLFFSGQPLTFIGILGLTGLTGIVINDGILLVDTANYYVKKGSPVNYAIMRAAKYRFFPVVLTSVTTIIGLVPLLFSKNMFSQLALTFVSGLFSSTLLLLFVVPVLYQRLMKSKR